MSPTMNQLKEEMAKDIQEFDSHDLTRISEDEYYEYKKIDNKSSNKYKRKCNGAEIDVYDVLKAFRVFNPATQHAIKKLLASGQRGYKDVVQDLNEAKDSITRAIELEV